MQDKDKKFGNIDIFLKKFQNILPRDRFVKEHIQRVLRQELNIDLDRDKIAVQGKQVRVSCSSAMKNELRLKQEKIIRELHKRGVVVNQVN
jgi:hypothetical protein